MTTRASLALLLLSAIIAPACGEGRAAAETVQIAVVPKGTTHEFWKSVHAGARKASAELGVEIIWKGPLREDDRDEQIKVLEAFIARGVDGIVVAPLDETALVPTAREAARRRIPIVVIDSDLAWNDRVSYVATDNYRGGVLAARELGGLLEDGGRVLVVRYVEGSASTMQREAGFLDTIQVEFPDIEIASENQHSGATVEEAYRVAENLLVAFPDVDGVFGPCEPVVFGMLRALEDAGRAGEIRLVGFDATEKLVEGLRNGSVDALVVQNPFAMGELGVRAVVQYLNGQEVEERIDTGVVVATRANMDEPAIRRLLFPDLSVLKD